MKSTAKRIDEAKSRIEQASDEIDRAKEAIRLFVLVNRNRKRVAELSGVHLNTVSDFVSGRRGGIRIDTLIKIEKACHLIKESPFFMPKNYPE